MQFLLFGSLSLSCFVCVSSQYRPINASHTSFGDILYFAVEIHVTIYYITSLFDNKFREYCLLISKTSVHLKRFIRFPSIRIIIGSSCVNARDNSMLPQFTILSLRDLVLTTIIWSWLVVIRCVSGHFTISCFFWVKLIFI